MKKSLGPDVRLAVTVHSGSMKPENIARALPPPPVIRLAHKSGAQGDNNLIGGRGIKQLDPSSAPALLVSYVYLEPFIKTQKLYAYRDWSLDCGAHSAHNSGTAIDHEAFIERARELLATDPTLTEVFALDVIGDWRASIKNAEYMWKKGVPGIPAFHHGEPWDVLLGIARDYPKIAVGGMGGLNFNTKLRWMGECFSRVWPKRIHGFGQGSERAIMTLPFHSVDATNWEVGACKFGNWRSFGRMSVRGSSQNLRAEVEHYLKMERAARSRWAKEMALLDSLDDAPSVRLALAKDQNPDTSPKSYVRIMSALGKSTPPSVRLAVADTKGGRNPRRFSTALGKKGTK